MSARSFPLNAEGHITPRKRCFTTRTRFASLSALKQVHTVRAGFLRVHETSGGAERNPRRYPDRLPPLRTTARAGRFPAGAGPRQLSLGITDYVPGATSTPAQSIAKTARFQLFPAKF
ncbi:hypothetical protein SSAG_03794 [Streptomyces sp. Mg1]|nr:hypothetical protein SSAG_03794 [Streptomyces sp. Mg1]